ncbi:hypothetical protein QF032_000150 [Streptomyces achromogenes]|nr:hypothetical protein [Streptomyces achromogenes]
MQVNLGGEACRLTCRPCRGPHGAAVCMARPAAAPPCVRAGGTSSMREASAVSAMAVDAMKPSTRAGGHSPRAPAVSHGQQLGHRRLVAVGDAVGALLVWGGRWQRPVGRRASSRRLMMPLARVVKARAASSAAPCRARCRADPAFSPGPARPRRRSHAGGSPSPGWMRTSRSGWPASPTPGGRRVLRLRQGRLRVHGPGEDPGQAWVSGQQPYAARLSPPAAKVLDAPCPSTRSRGSRTSWLPPPETRGRLPAAGRRRPGGRGAARPQHCSDTVGESGPPGSTWCSWGSVPAHRDDPAETQGHCTIGIGPVRRSRE